MKKKPTGDSAAGALALVGTAALFGPGKVKSEPFVIFAVRNDGGYEEFLTL